MFIALFLIKIGNFSVQKIKVCLHGTYIRWYTMWPQGNIFTFYAIKEIKFTNSIWCTIPFFIKTKNIRIYKIYTPIPTESKMEHLASKYKKWLFFFILAFYFFKFHNEYELT